MQPKISIVIPAYNEQDYIWACLDSVLSNCKDLIHEIIVVDNASIDNTPKIIKSYQSKWVKYIRENRKWLVRARQAWYKSSTGDIIAYIDADTLVPRWWTEKIIAQYTKHKDLVFLSGPYHYHDAVRSSKITLWIYRNIFAYISYLIVWYLGIWWNMIMKKSMLDKIWWFDIDIEFYGEDTNIARRASHVWRCIFDTKLVISTSARRLTQQWWIKTWWIYIKNFLSQSILKRSVDDTYKDYR